MQRLFIAPRYLSLNLILVITAITLTIIGVSYHASALNYSAGTYGTCTYGTCTITLGTSGSVAINVTPAAGATTCSVQKDGVTAITDSSTGYTVTMTNTDTITTLTSGGNIITAHSGSPAAPTALAANTGGYRVDGIAGFGAGPTSAVVNGSVPGFGFSGVPDSAGTPGLIRSTNTTDAASVSTDVWYGVCASSSLPSGSYIDGVTYTALIN